MIPLIFEEPTSTTLNELLVRDGDVVVWWGTWIECSVTVSRLRRENKLAEIGEEAVRLSLSELSADWQEVEPDEDLRLLAMLVSRDHPLKAADCLQLAAALRWCEGDTEGASFVCLDNQLRRAAEDEGFDVLPGGELL